MSIEIEKFEYKGNGEFQPHISLEKFIFEFIKKVGPATRGEITKLTNIPRTTIFDTIEKLKELDLIIVRIYQNRRRGRPKKFYQVRDVEIEFEIDLPTNSTTLLLTDIHLRTKFENIKSFSIGKMTDEKGDY